MSQDATNADCDSYPALCNIETEAALLGALMRDVSIFDRVADGMREEDFFEPVHGRIFSAIRQLAEANQPTNPIMVGPLLASDSALTELGGQGYLFTLASNVAAMIGAKDFAQQIVRLSKRRLLHAALAELVTDAAAVDGPELSEIVDRVDAAIQSAVGEETKLTDLSALQVFDAVMLDQDDTSGGVRCPDIAKLDRLLGDLKPGNYAVMAGRPGMGKTATAVSYAVSAARKGHGTAFFTLEMSALEIGQRMAADAAFDDPDGIPFAAITKRKLNKFDRDKLALVRTEMNRLPLRVIDTAGLRVGRLAGMVRRQKRRMAAKGQKLELIVIDYLQLLQPDRKTDSQYQAVSDVSKAVKELAKDNGVAVLALAQLSRKVEERSDKRPIMADLRDSGQIEQDADAMILLFRPEYYLQQSEPGPVDPGRQKWEDSMESARGKIEFIVPKCRNGVPGSAMGSFHASFQAVR